VEHEGAVGRVEERRCRTAGRRWDGAFEEHAGRRRTELQLRWFSRGPLARGGGTDLKSRAPDSDPVTPPCSLRPRPRAPRGRWFLRAQPQILASTASPFPTPVSPPPLRPPSMVILAVGRTDPVPDPLLQPPPPAAAGEHKSDTMALVHWFRLARPGMDSPAPPFMGTGWLEKSQGRRIWWGQRLDGDGGGCWCCSRLGQSWAEGRHLDLQRSFWSGWARDWSLRPLASLQRRKQHRWGFLHFFV
jgi:hypothetical protein